LNTPSTSSLSFNLNLTINKALMTHADAAINHQPFTAYLFGVLLYMGVGSFTYGYASSIIATTLGQPSFYAYFTVLTGPNGAALIGAMNGLYFAGGFLGVLIFPAVADRWGRKMGITVVSDLLKARPSPALADHNLCDRDWCWCAFLEHSWLEVCTSLNSLCFA
jgi:MFS family permease